MGDAEKEAYGFPVVIEKDKDGTSSNVKDRLEKKDSQSDLDLIEQRRDEPSRPFRAFLAEKKRGNRSALEDNNSLLR